MRGFFLVLLFALIVEGVTMADNDPAQQLQQSREYVRGLDGGVVYGDGYLRQPPVEASISRVAIPGPFLSAWQVAYKDFLELDDLDVDQKQLHHYAIHIALEKDRYVVLFRALLIPHIVDGEPQGVMHATFGKSVRYRIDPVTLDIRQRLFEK